jgi:hypothetical protein
MPGWEPGRVGPQVSEAAVEGDEHPLLRQGHVGDDPVECPAQHRGCPHVDVLVELEPHGSRSRTSSSRARAAP